MSTSLPEQPSPGLPRGTRQQILNVAAKRFLEKGYTGTTLREIAAAVGMKAGSLYYHFPSKEALLLEILQRSVDVVIEAFQATAESHRSSDPRSRFKAHVRAHFEALIDYRLPHTAVGMATFYMAPESIRTAYVSACNTYTEMWNDLLREFRENGDITADVPVEVATLALFGALGFAVDWFPENHRRPLEAAGSRFGLPDDIDTCAGAIAHTFWSGLSKGSAS